MGNQKKTIIKNREIRISINAFENINEVTRYIAFANKRPLNAIKVGDAIFEKIERIGQEPLLLKNVSKYQLKQKSIARLLVHPGKLSTKLPLQKLLFLG